ncbi:unnamed protein product [Candidula unifasciata]|uniref:Ferritin n=1 Tax=Candidula unifasciata TaxID=100452 RepID=A0A8S3YKF9_9EUPU|nr:unnamed protein product [Candidula unifasciata]
MSLARQNYSEECEAAVNRQINLELYANYVYLSMAYHFDREDVALPGFLKFFQKLSDEERERAEKLMKYQNTRGGRVLLQDVKKPDSQEWGSSLDALTSALQLHRSLNQSLLDLHHVAENSNDAQLGDFIEGEFLANQVNAIKQMTDLIAQLNRAGSGLGEYLFDKETLQKLA